MDGPRGDTGSGTRGGIRGGSMVCIRSGTRVATRRCTRGGTKYQVLGVVIGVVHNRGVLGVVLIICMKWPPGEFSLEFANFCQSGDSGKSCKSGDF